MAAHNEEKIIAKSLENLVSLPYEDYEILIGLDGCTDKTKEIVEKFSKISGKIKYYNLNLRKGKPSVINYLIKKSSGEIIIIQDADWIFKVKDAKSMNNFLSIFNNRKIGGIAESFPVEWNDNLKKGNLTYKMVAYSTFLWMKFQKERLAEEKGSLFYVKNPTMFLTNVFRKKLYKENISLGDDFERTQDIFNRGYEIVLFPQETMPRMISSYRKINFKDFFKQKIRTAVARKQLNKTKRMQTSLRNYYIPSVWFILVNGWKTSFYIGLLMTAWIFLTSFATFLSIFKTLDTKKGWTLRAKRF